MSQQVDPETMWSSRRSGIVFLLLLLLYVSAIAIGAQLIQVSDPEQTDVSIPLWRYLAQELGR